MVEEDMSVIQVYPDILHGRLVERVSPKPATGLIFTSLGLFGYYAIIFEATWRDDDTIYYKLERIEEREWL